MPPKFKINPAWPQLLGVLSLLIAIAAGAFRYLLLDAGDPYHCSTLLNDGSWLDSASRNWQPEGCLLHSYKPNEGATCLGSREVAFVGDSVTRKLFFQFAHLLDPSLATEPPNDNQRHQDHDLQTTHGTRVVFVWDPFLNGTYITSALSPSSTGRNGLKKDPPALLVLGSGLWYLRYADTSGGIPAWEANIENLFEKLSAATKPIADSIVVLPVEEVVPSMLSAERSNTMHPSDIDAMNSDLYHRVAQHMPVFEALLSPFLVHLPRVFNLMLDESATTDGIHYGHHVVQAQANILLNMRCNDVLPKEFPFSKTCCNRYPRPNAIHAILLLAIMISTPLFCYFTATSGLHHTIANAWNPTTEPYFNMSVGLLVTYLSDRSWFWLKEQKQFNSWTFAALYLVALCSGLATLKRADNDLGFLNRDQTDEWKGWMQLAILIYHYLGASKISGIYNPVRILVASYLFMTGYGHTTFYLRKADFGFLRIAQVLIRLNLLTVFLAYVMDTDYISYYFSPLVSMWYLIIYLTMAIAPQLNGRTPILLLKVLFSAALVTWFMWEPTVLETLFFFLERVFGIHWSAREWLFRVNLDLWIVYVGMLTSIFVIKVREYRWTDHPRWPLATKIAIGCSTLVLVWFFAFELYQDSKFAYNRWHPYISFLPVMAFAILRNSSVILRSASSSAFAFVGRCSLETFILQYHIWLAGDTKGVLIVLPGARLRPVNFVLTSIMFLYLSHKMADATTKITARICNQEPKQPPLPLPNSAAQMPAPSSHSQIDLDHHTQEVEIPLMPTPTKDEDGNGIPLEPDTPIRPRHLLDRLAKQQAQTSSSIPVKILAFVGGLQVKGKILIGLGFMWILNILWLYA
ncbi:O-acetyltransferase [Coprinopsis marcescibilis]|uniref:O-acetyltransferase n=1 Tax=Coprinopsis marcescibilis TaxID=230819 RepID=A0A5C3LC68_COPMA|nr:O-acetyltransferase [Coprinopsis marcescibilis]